MINFLLPFGLSGILWSLFRRIRLYPYEPFWGIVNNDYYFSEYATIPLLSFFYTIYQGLAYGVGVGFLSFKLITGLSKVLQNYEWCEKVGALAKCDSGNEYFLYALLSFASVILVRVSIEGYMLVYKVGQVLIDRFELTDGIDEYDDFDNHSEDF